MDIERYKKKIDENLVSRLVMPSENLNEALNLLRSKDASLGGRILALMNVINSVLSDNTVRSFRNFLKKKDLQNLPFKEDFIVHKKQFIEGMQKDVHLLESVDSKKQSFVVKIEYCEKGCTVEDAMKKAQVNKLESKYLQAYYNIKGLIPNEVQIITKASSDDKLAIVTVQEYLGQDIKDIFEIDFDNLIKILENDVELKKIFKQFTEKTFNLYRDNLLVDLMGKKNIVLVTNEKGKRLLKFIDPQGLIDITKQNINNEEDKKYMDKFNLYIKYLDSVYRAVE